ncbi:MAG TPA: TIM barrel protein [Ktedonobacteraceae bacterium]|jgi:sugar phosphate isomerase/epimerase|nr:TIM barrel protein [Ktedonobacteraceae bacterium]
MIRLSAFADEISPDLDEQLAVLEREQIAYLDLRGAWNTNVLDFSDEQVRTIQEKLAANNIQVAAIASPIGKTPIDRPFEETLRQMERAVTLAHTFSTSYIRIFSFYPPTNGLESEIDLPMWHQEVVDRLRTLTAQAKEAGIILLHENEKDIYGATVVRCLDIMQSCEEPALRMAFDPANFIQCGQTPFPDAYEVLRPWVEYVHVKDALPDGKVVVAGAGAGQWREFLRQLQADGYEGFLALEPHLAAEGQFGGFSGADLFHQAVHALKGLLEEMRWEYS